jgi:hypothetical protein
MTAVVITTLATGGTLLAATGLAYGQPAGTGVIEGRIWFDRNANQTQDGSEPGLRKDNVVSLSRDGQPVATVSTDDQGRYHIDGLDPGTYHVTNEDHGRYANTTPIEAEVAVADGVVTVNFGIRGGSIVGTAWRDLNFDGVRQPDEPAMPGNPPTCCLPLTQLVGPPGFFRESPNDDQGNYRFEDLPSGIGYQVVTPSWKFAGGWSWTRPGQDSMVDFTTGRSAPMDIAQGNGNYVVDVGYFQPRGDGAAGNLRSEPDRKVYRVGETVTLTMTVTNRGQAPDVLGLKAEWPTGLSLAGCTGMVCAGMDFVLHNVSQPGEATVVSVTLRADQEIKRGDIRFTVPPGPFGDVNPRNDKVTREIKVRAA